MSKLIKKKLEKYTNEQIAEAINNAPDCIGDVYWHYEINLYYTRGRRRNALVFCADISDWRTSTRYNEELANLDIFVPVQELASLVE